MIDELTTVNDPPFDLFVDFQMAFLRFRPDCRARSLSI